MDAEEIHRSAIALYKKLTQNIREIVGNKILTKIKDVRDSNV